MQDCDEQTATKEHNDELKAYKKRKGIPSDVKIFVILGKFRCIREELLRRGGWVEHEWWENEGKHNEESKFLSMAYDFGLFKSMKDAFRTPLAPT